MASRSRDGVVFLVGGGPGDPGLLTRRGAEVLASADVVIHDGLVSGAVVALASPRAERIYAGKKRGEGGEPLSQDAINDLLVERARRGLRVVRLKGGDPFVFGRGAEEVRILADAGIAFEIVPGVTSATAVPAYAGIPLTARNVTSTATLVTGHEAPGKADSAVDWEAVARSGTVVLFMALSKLRDCTDKLIAAGRDPDTPAAAIYWGTTGAQRTVSASLKDLPSACKEQGLVPPVLVVIGDVVAMRPSMSWFESRPLFGKRVLITRSGERAMELARRVSELGGEPVQLPVTAVVPAGDAAEIDVCCRRLEAGGFDWVIFASGNAVDHFLDALWARGLDARALRGSRLAAVGAQTRGRLEGRGLRADLVPAHGDARALAEAVKATSSTGSRILVPRSASGRPELLDGLRAGTSEVTPLSVYETRARAADDPVLADGLSKLRRGRIEVALMFAPSQVRALGAILGEQTREVLGSVSVLGTIGKTTARALEDAGLRADVVASSPDAEVLLTEVAALAAGAARRS